MTTDLDRLIEAVEAGRKTTVEVWAAALGSNWRYGTEAASGSLDAAVMLLEALLPDWDWSAHGNGQAALWPPGTPDQQNAGAIETDVEDNPARALLLATLRAYRSTREGG